MQLSGARTVRLSGNILLCSPWKGGTGMRPRQVSGVRGTQVLVHTHGTPPQRSHCSPLDIHPSEPQWADSLNEGPGL